MNDTILINRLPTRTWNRLGVNETALTWGQADDLGEEKITAAGQTDWLRRARREDGRHPRARGPDRHGV